MPGKNFRGKPSNSHIVWSRETRQGAKRTRFDTEQFQRWASHYGFDIEKEKRVDHDRAMEKRKQYRCVFAWTSTAGESIEFDDQEWELGDQKTPETFIEIDSKAVARVKNWEREFVVDVEAMQHSGTTLLVRPEDEEAFQIDAEKMATRPE